ncbi:hypothetical protein ACJVC5_06175 [Peredibacter sp. HCB2-198]|uniref:hypothetical protein n=1 Tax=Peredibacter sp. HCB2-198 TaxID=3383025 RepID=UPI0038B56400
MKTVIIVSKCLRVTKFNSEARWYEFHFKGAYAGERVKKVMLIGSNQQLLKAGEEYLIYVRLLSCEAGVLKGEILKSKPLDECWDRS